MAFDSENYVTDIITEQVGNYEVTFNYTLGEMAYTVDYLFNISYLPEFNSFTIYEASNLYYIINDGLVEIMGYDLISRIEFSAEIAWKRRKKKNAESNFSNKAIPFINLIIEELKNPYNINSVDEIINDFILNRQNEFEGMTTIYTATFITMYPIIKYLILIKNFSQCIIENTKTNVVRERKTRFQLTIKMFVQNQILF